MARLKHNGVEIAQLVRPDGRIIRRLFQNGKILQPRPNNTGFRVVARLRPDATFGALVAAWRKGQTNRPGHTVKVLVDDAILALTAQPLKRVKGPMGSRLIGTPLRMKIAADKLAAEKEEN